MLDYENFALQDNPANIHIGFQMPMPAPEEVPKPMASNESTTPKITLNMPRHHLMAAANRAPGFGWGVALSSASPIQVGMPATSPWKTLMHGTTTEEALFCGATLLCTLQQEMSLLSLPPLLTDNHI